MRFVFTLHPLPLRNERSNSGLPGLKALGSFYDPCFLALSPGFDQSRCYRAAFYDEIDDGEDV